MGKRPRTLTGPTPDRKKLTKSAWEDTIRDAGVQHIPGQTSLPTKATTRSSGGGQGRDFPDSTGRRGAKSSRGAKRGGFSDLFSVHEEIEIKRKARLDRLEATNAWDPIDGLDGVHAREEEEEDDNYAESSLSEDSDNRPKKKKSKSKKKKVSGMTPGANAAKIKREPISLVDAIMSDEPPPTSSISLISTSALSTTNNDLNHQTTSTSTNNDDDSSGQLDWVSAAVKPSFYPSNPVCDATGKLGRYRDPATGLRYHDRRALALLGEAQPLWFRALAVSPYWEAVAQVVADCEQKRRQ